MSMQILTEELKKGKIRNLYLFYGPEEYLKNYYLEVIEKNILHKNNAARKKSKLAKAMNAALEANK
jgi:DNA polymerase-3 subunit delta